MMPDYRFDVPVTLCGTWVPQVTPQILAHMYIVHIFFMVRPKSMIFCLFRLFGTLIPTTGSVFDFDSHGVPHGGSGPSGLWDRNSIFVITSLFLLQAG